MGKLVIILSLLFLNFSESNQADTALQKVLELDEVQGYFNKSPRFTTSNHYKILLLKEADVELQQEQKINSIPLEIRDKSNSVDKSELIVYIELNKLNIKNNSATINLDIQNAKLLLEDQQKVRLNAELKFNDNEWEIKNYDLKQINISE